MNIRKHPYVHCLLPLPAPTCRDARLVRPLNNGIITVRVYKQHYPDARAVRPYKVGIRTLADININQANTNLCPRTVKTVSKTLIFACKMRNQTPFPMATISKPHVSAYKAKGHLSPCERCPFARRFAAYCKAVSRKRQEHFAAYMAAFAINR